MVTPIVHEIRRLPNGFPALDDPVVQLKLTEAFFKGKLQPEGTRYQVYFHYELNSGMSFWSDIIIGWVDLLAYVRRFRATSSVCHMEVFRIENGQPVTFVPPPRKSRFK